MNITGRPVKFEKSNYKKNMITQMTQPVKRKYDVLLERSTGGWSARVRTKQSKKLLIMKIFKKVLNSILFLQLFYFYHHL